MPPLPGRVLSDRGESIVRDTGGTVSTKVVRTRSVLDRSRQPHRPVDARSEFRVSEGP